LTAIESQLGKVEHQDDREKTVTKEAQETVEKAQMTRKKNV
jgi:hypothetical protein